ncbi:HAMP domain-containing histidine kinase [Endozoicomonas sp. G2_1]|uniref:sensor histidine kinase n=1 Tax=Endozoicomonas sp. G2_1 TaxID=2821091 RepID=UPI001ADBB17F|nr:HAMP domain-containing sensor histidine kinase [Endozoicomonas sp. G2_1]MBO9489109.1 HAMP domain-containing histidine kinase [Endozoicomonas sp. G2_1]
MLRKSVSVFSPISQALNWRPTLVQQFVLSISLAFVPLSLVVILFLQTLDHELARGQQQSLLVQEVSQEFNKLNDNSASLERAIRQNWLLNNQELEQVIINQWLQTEQGYQLLVQKLNRDADVAIWQQLLKQLSVVGNIIEETGANSAQQNSESLNLLNQLLLEAQRWLSQWQQQQIIVSQQNIQALQQRFVRWLMLLIPLSIVSAAFFIWLMSRGLNRITEAISLLGQGRFQHKVEVQGSAELVALSKKLEWMRQQLAKLEQQKTTFLQHVTHELKTPLASIIEGTELLREEIAGPVNAQQQTVLTLLNQNSERLHNMIKSLLNYNAIKIKRDHCRQLDIQVLKQTIEQHFEQRLASKQQALTWQLEQDNPCYLDADLLEIILVQLVSNGLKFSPVQVNVTIVMTFAANSLLIAVIDGGPGVSDVEQERVFDAFYLGQQGKQNQVQGSGLGLTLVKECVEQLGGNINLTSPCQPNGGGARFDITLPYQNRSESQSNKQ